MWTPEAVEYLRANWRRQSAAVIARKLKCTRNAVIGKARRLGLAMTSNVPRPDGWTTEQTALLRLGYGTVPVNDIGHALGRSRDAVTQKAGELGIRKRHLSRLQPPSENRNKLSTARAS